MKIPVGKESFEEIRRDRSCYVDKTGFLYELLRDPDSRVTVITRPRRFGKTLLLSMTESFLSIQRDSRALFADLEVMGHEDFCAEWMNRYPVLSVSFSGISDLSFEEAYATLQVKLADVCKIHEKLLASGRIREEDRQIFSDLMSQRASDAGVREALRSIWQRTKSEPKPGIIPRNIGNKPGHHLRNRYFGLFARIIFTVGTGPKPDAVVIEAKNLSYKRTREIELMLMYDLVNTTILIVRG